MTSGVGLALPLSLCERTAMNELKISDVFNDAMQLVEVGWCQQACQNTRRSVGEVINCYCAVGAIRKIICGSAIETMLDSSLYRNSLSTMLQSISGEIISDTYVGLKISRWNDEKGRTQQEVIGALYAARQMALTQEQAHA